MATGLWCVLLRHCTRITQRAKLVRRLHAKWPSPLAWWFDGDSFVVTKVNGCHLIADHEICKHLSLAKICHFTVLCVVIVDKAHIQEIQFIADSHVKEYKSNATNQCHKRTIRNLCRWWVLHLQLVPPNGIEKPHPLDTETNKLHRQVRKVWAIHTPK